MDKLTARGLDASNLADGQYVIDVASGKVTGWVAVPAVGVETVTAIGLIRVDATDLLNPIIRTLVPVTTPGVGGVPGIVFDTDGSIVWTELV